MLYATNSTEEAVEAALSALREAVTSEAPATVPGLLNSVLARWRRLDRDSPYRRAALIESAELADRYGAEDETRARHLLPERERLVSTLARQELGDQLRSARSTLGLSVRRAADQAGISASYLSELESARVGLPSPDVASRLDASLGVSATELVVDARAEADRLRAERLRTSGGVAAQTVETDPRQVEAAAALRRDPSLIDVLDYARRLDAPERRAVLALMRELTA